MNSLLIKISGEALQSSQGIYDTQAIQTLVETLGTLQSAGNNLAIVVGGGNIWRARDTIDMGIERVVSDHLGMTATIMNAVVLSQLCTKHGLASIVYAPAHHQIPNATHTYEALAARAAMQEGKIILCAGGLSLPYNTTDATAVQRALELGCNTVIKATKVDGVYDKDPNKYPDAKKYETLSYEQALQEQLTIMDQHAFALARSEQLPLYVCHMNDLAMRGTSDMNGTAVGV